MKKKFARIFCLLFILTLLSGCSVKKLLSTVSGESGQTETAAQSYSSGNATFTEPVQELNLDWAAGSVEITYHDESTVIIEETAKEPIAENNKMAYSLENGVLDIRFRSDLGSITCPAKTLRVTLPKNVTLQKADIDLASAGLTALELLTEKAEVSSASGSVTLSTAAKKVKISCASGEIDFTHTGDAENIELETASGNITANVCNADDLEVDSSSGRIRLSADTVQEMEIDATSGKVDCTLKSQFSECEISSASGGITLHLPENADFAAELDTASGKISYDLPMTVQNGKYMAGNGSAELAVSTASGDIEICKNK